MVRPTSRAISRLRGQAAHSRRYEKRFGDEAIDGLDLPQLYERRMEASMRAFGSYEPGKYRGDVTVLSCRTRRLLHRNEPGLGWVRWTTGRVTLRPIPGHHHNLFKVPQIGKVAEELVKIVQTLDGLSCAHPKRQQALGSERTLKDCKALHSSRTDF